MNMEKFEQPVKIFIRDIWELKQGTEDINYYIFKGKLIRKVDVMGIVTESRSLDSKQLYRVDDGTGTVMCSFNHYSNKNLAHLSEIEDLQNIVGNSVDKSEECNAMEYLLTETLKAQKKIMTPLQQGDPVHLQGFISSFHGTREIAAFILYKVCSHVDEIDRVFEMSTLYSKVYLQD